MAEPQGFCPTAGLLVPKVLAFARSKCLWAPGERILVALSGGPDSVALLYILRHVAADEGLALGAAHVNYRLRGAESDGDALFCEQLCERLDIPLHLRMVKSSPQGNLQNWARKIRYEFFDECRREFGYTRVAVAHTADDRAETFLLQFFRGAGADALGHVPESSSTLIRPLAEARRAEVMAYLAEGRIAFRVDRSNFELKYRRNRVRHELLPLLERIIEADPVSAINEQAELLAVDAEYMDAQAALLLASAQHDHGEIRLAIDHLRQYHSSLQLRALRRLAADMGVASGRETSLRLLGLLDQQPGRRVELGGGAVAERSRDSVWFYRSSDALTAAAVQCPGTTTLPDGTTLVADAANGGTAYPDGTYRARMVLPETGKLSVRPARGGDRMSPFGMKETRLVFDILADAGVPRHRRQHVWVLTADDVIYWALGVRMAEQGRVREAGPGIYEFSWRTGSS